VHQHQLQQQPRLVCLDVVPDDLLSADCTVLPCPPSVESLAAIHTSNKLPISGGEVRISSAGLCSAPFFSADACENSMPTSYQSQP